MTITSPYTPASFNGSGTTGPFSFTFRILDKTNIKVEKVVGTTVTTLTEGVGAGQYSIVLVAAGLSGGQITLGTALAIGERLIVSRVTPRTQLEKLADLRRFNAEIHERAFDKATMVIQETEQIGSSAVKFPTADTPGLNQTLPVDASRANKIMGFNSTGEPVVTDLTVAQLNDFAQAVVDVEAAAADAQADAVTATTQAGIATTQAGIATAAVEGIPYRDVVFLTFANSPYTMTNADRGKMFSIDTSGGNFVFNLAQISTLTMPFTVGIKKATNDANIVTINRAGTDLIDAATSYIISTVAGVNLVGDTDGTPDKWTSAAFGAGAGEQKVQTFIGGVDYTAGTSTTLTLTNTPVSPSSAALEVFFDGVAQHPSEWSYNQGTGIITFTSAIPVGVAQVFTRWASSSVVIGTPSDGTVSWAKLASGIIASVANMVSGASSLLVSAANFFTYVDTYQPKKVLSFVPAGGSTDIVINYTFRAGFNYRIQIDKIEVGTNNTVLQLLMSNDNGSTYLNTASAYTARRIYGTSGVAGDTSASTVANITGYGMLANVGLSGEMLLLNPAAGSKRPMGRFDYLMTETGTSLANGLTHFLTNANFTCNKIKLSSSTNFSNTGRITVYEEPAT